MEQDCPLDLSIQKMEVVTHQEKEKEKENNASLPSMDDVLKTWVHAGFLANYFFSEEFRNSLLESTQQAEETSTHVKEITEIPKLERRASHTSDICGKKYLIKGNPRRHELNDHEQLPEVDKFNNQAEETLTHIQKTTEIPKVKEKDASHACDVCNKRYLRKSNLSRHKLSAHKQSLKVNKFDCELCGRSFANERNLNVHRRFVHGDSRNNECSVCGRLFMSMSSLKDHQRFQHEGLPKKYACDDCDKRFRRHGELKKHRRVHTGTRLKNHGYQEMSDNARLLERHQLLVHQAKVDNKD